MDIYKLLSTVPHNSRYLDRYFNFISWCRNKNKHITKRTSKFPDGEYMESHHILPKGIFPDYANFRKNSWNKIDLTARQHFIAHWILWKLYGESQTQAFYLMTRENNFNININSKVYESVKKDRSIEVSRLFTGIPKSEAHVNKINRNPEKIRKTAETHKGMKRSEHSKILMGESRKKFLKDNGGAQNKGTKVHHNIKTFEVKWMISGDAEWKLGWGPSKIHKKCYWDGVNPNFMKKFIPGEEPNGWINGNPKNPNKRLDLV